MRVHLEITNLTINAANGFCDAAAELSSLRLDNVLSVHVAGGVAVDHVTRDAHAFPVPETDIAWLERLVPQMPSCRTIVIERDGRHQAVEEVADDLRRVQAVVGRPGSLSPLCPLRRPFAWALAPMAAVMSENQRGGWREPL
jgi:uncharacterized protein (UPF0276 family)